MYQHTYVHVHMHICVCVSHMYMRTYPPAPPLKQNARLTSMMLHWDDKLGDLDLTNSLHPPPTINKCIPPHQKQTQG